MKKYKILLIVLFLTLLAGGTIPSLFLPEKESSVLENRELSKTPKISLKKFVKGTFQKKYEDSLNDQFFLRDKWVSLAVNIQAAAGKKEINQVYLGNDGYLLEKYQESEIDKEQVEENIETLVSFLHDMTERYGKGKVTCMMIPSKSDVMTDKMPLFAENMSPHKTVEQLKQKMTEPDELLDLQETLQRHQNEYIYYRTDHHWTTLGAYYAYQAWCQKKGDSACSLSDFQRETVYDDFYGTSYNKVHVNVPPDTVEVFHSKAEDGIQLNMDDGEVKSNQLYFPDAAMKGFNRYDIFFSKNTFKIEISTKAKTGKTLLVVKDSFANCFVPLLLEKYDKIIMIDYRYGKTPIGKVITESGPVTDVLVMFNTEKFMKNTKLGKLADTRMKSDTMKEFDMNDLLNG